MTIAFSDGIDRRNFLRVGSAAGLSLAQILRLQSTRAAEKAKAKSKDINCIFIFTLGGMPQHDMWDYKADAPAEIRGDFKPIRTNVPGIGLTDLLPHTAKVTDQLAILRSLTHGDSDHGHGYHIMMTGFAPGPGDFNSTKNNNVHPSLGSMVARMTNQNAALPPYISVPCFLRSGGPAFLGPSYAPFVIEADPASPEFAVRDVVLPEGVGTDRAARRRDALREINRLEKSAEEMGKDVRALDAFSQKAYRLMTSDKAKEAFDLKREKAATREAYGMSSFGQCSLLSRRLVEAGARFVSIENGHWDTHRENTKSLRDLLVIALRHHGRLHRRGGLQPQRGQDVPRPCAQESANLRRAQAHQYQKQCGLRSRQLGERRLPPSFPRSRQARPDHLHRHAHQDATRQPAQDRE